VLRTTRSHVRDNFVAYLALCVALGGSGALAATSIVGSNGKLNGCVTKKGKRKGTLRVVAPGTRCRHSERAIAWNQRGPQGVAGAGGARGADGAQGAGGAPGTDGATGPPGSPDTPAQVLEKLKQVDGDGSALDSDLLDGHETAFFQRRGSSTACTGTNKATGLGATGDVTCAADNTTPSGTAGGDLAGSYPNPALAPFPQITLFGVWECATSNSFEEVIPNNVDTALGFHREASGFWPASAADTCGFATLGTEVIETPRTGTYLITAGVVWPPNATGQRALGIDLDGTIFASQRGDAAAVGETHTNVTTLVRLTNGVHIRAKAFQNSGAAMTLTASLDHREFLSAVWLGPH
jgi:hypothetical protein